METGSYWKQFESTGKIEDYLSYKAMLPKEKNEGSDKKEAEAESDRQQGAVPYAGFY
ncbi:MAG: YqzL family protein [Lachnospiraceae bacterium]|nr:YqzL family protein [Lachnospiraceae bacterium]